jgi:acyl-homoserine lactone acylase PvdQ
MKRLTVLLTGALLVAAGLVVPERAPAAVTAPPPDYCGTQCLDILPPGQNGNATFTDLLLFKTLGIRPPHFSDTLAPYQNLVWNYSGITDDRLGAYFDRMAFGVPTGDVASTIRPRADVTIVRDRSRGIPHITGTTREGTLFGAGYAGAQDRLFVMDVFRHLGRGQLTPFAGGAPGNRALEQDLWRSAPYTEVELQRQVDILDDLHGAQGAQLQRDLQAWVAGVNHYIDHVGLGYPGEYVALGLPRPQRWQPTDVVATAAVIAGIFGGGGGGEIQSALALIESRVRYGAAGTEIWKSFRSQNDPETNHTVHNGSTFPYGQTVEEPAGRALPDRGSVTSEPLVVNATAAARAAYTGPSLLKQPMSNALLVSGAHTKSGHPVAVYGPQTGYFAPQLWMRQELQGPGISSRGVAFAGLNFYNLLGRGVDYSWSATSAGQDITDTYAVRLCEPDGGTPTLQSLYYVFRGTCTPMETLERRNAWKQSLGSPEPAGAYTLRVRRTKLGIVSHRGTVGGVPVAFTRNRSTYMNEAGPALGFMLFNDPDTIRSASDFQRAAHKVGYAFNWFYADSNDIGYFNSGDNPVRPSGADPNLPTWGEPQYEWVGWDPASNRATYTPFEEHPQVINQDYLTSWNNKQAPGYSAADGNYAYGAVHRVQPLDDRIQAVIQSGEKFTRGKLVEAMEDAATVDLRADKVLPLLLRVLESTPIADPALVDAVAKLKAWQQAGGHRLAPPGSSTYSHSAAIRILDAWWPLLVQAQFRPALGPDLYAALARTLPLDQRANPQGSAYQAGWWGFVHRDLRKVLGEPAPQPVTFCGGGSLAECRAVLLDSLATALAVPATTTYPATGECAAGNQFCSDQIVHQPMGGITQSRIHWVNRPTYQQVLEFPSRR